MRKEGYKSTYLSHSMAMSAKWPSHYVHLSCHLGCEVYVFNILFGPGGVWLWSCRFLSSLLYVFALDDGWRGAWRCRIFLTPEIKAGCNSNKDENRWTATWSSGSSFHPSASETPSSSYCCLTCLLYAPTIISFSLQCSSKDWVSFYNFAKFPKSVFQR